MRPDAGASVAAAAEARIAASEARIAASKEGLRQRVQKEASVSLMNVQRGHCQMIGAADGAGSVGADGVGSVGLCDEGGGVFG